MNWQPSAGRGGTPGGIDGLRYEEWAAGFGNPDPESDEDHDQRVALLEFAEGGSPDQSAPVGETVRVMVNPADESVVVSFRRSLLVEGLQFEIEISDDLEDWRSVGDEWEFMGADSPGDGSAMFSFRAGVRGQASYIRQRVILRE